MIIIIITAIVGFAALALWKVVWVFWLVGVYYVFAGIDTATDHRVRDRRFKSGFKGNESDTSDLGAGARLIAIGLVICSLGLFAQDIQSWVVQMFSTAKVWWHANGWKVSLALIGIMIFAASIVRLVRNGGEARSKNSTIDSSQEKSVPDITRLKQQLQIDVICVLLYVGRADGQLRAPERSIILGTLERIGLSSNSSSGEIESLLAPSATPNYQAFKAAVGRLYRDDLPVLESVVDAAKQIVKTQKKVSEAEQDALDYLQRRIGRLKDA